MSYPNPQVNHGVNQNMLSTPQKREFESMRRHRNALRAGLLNELSDIRYQDEIELRNVETHGGDVLGDARVIQLAERLGVGRLNKYKQTFHQVYNFPYQLICDKVDRLDSRIMEVMDILGIVRILFHWRHHPFREDIQLKATAAGQ